MAKTKLNTEFTTNLYELIRQAQSKPSYDPMVIHKLIRQFRGELDQLEDQIVYDDFDESFVDQILHTEETAWISEDGNEFEKKIEQKLKVRDHPQWQAAWGIVEDKNPYRPGGYSPNHIFYTLSEDVNDLIRDVKSGNVKFTLDGIAQRCKRLRNDSDYIFGLDNPKTIDQALQDRIKAGEVYHYDVDEFTFRGVHLIPPDYISKEVTDLLEEKSGKMELYSLLIHLVVSASTSLASMQSHDFKENMELADHIAEGFNIDISQELDKIRELYARKTFLSHIQSLSGALSQYDGFLPEFEYVQDMAEFLGTESTIPVYLINGDVLEVPAHALYVVNLLNVAEFAARNGQGDYVITILNECEHIMDQQSELMLNIPGTNRYLPGVDQRITNLGTVAGYYQSKSQLISDILDAYVAPDDR